MATTWHGYIGIENLNLTNPQRATLVQGLRGLGPAQDRRPSWLNQARIRLDGNAAILEASFDDTTLTIAAIKARLAAIFNVAVGSISHTTPATPYGTAVRYTHSSQAKIQMIAFGGLAATHAQSAAQARAYLIANAAAWEEV